MEVSAAAADSAAAPASSSSPDALLRRCSTLPAPSLSTSVILEGAQAAGVSIGFFRLVARLQTRFRRLKVRAAAKARATLLEQRAREEAALAAKLAQGKAARVRASHAHSSSTFLELPGDVVASAAQSSGGPVRSVSPGSPQFGSISESPSSPSNAAAGAVGASPGSRPRTPASSRGGTRSPQRSPRLPNKAADLLFGSKKHEDKRADILGLSSGQMGLLDSLPQSHKALATLGMDERTGALPDRFPSPIIDRPGSASPSAAAVSAAKSPSAKEAAARDAAAASAAAAAAAAAASSAQGASGRMHTRSHSQSTMALHAGELAAEAEAERQRELESIRAAKREEAAAARAAQAATKAPVMSGKAQQILLGGTSNKGDITNGHAHNVSSSNVVLAPLRALSPVLQVPGALSPTSAAAAAAAAGADTDAISARAAKSHSKVLDKLGVTTKQLEMFPNSQSRAFAKLGVDQHVGASMLAADSAQHKRHAAASLEAERAGAAALREAQEAASLAAQQPKHQSSKKVSSLLLGGQDKSNKVLDRMGMSAKEMQVFQSQPKAFQKLGMFDAPTKGSARAQNSSSAAAQARADHTQLSKKQAAVQAQQLALQQSRDAAFAQQQNKLQQQQSAQQQYVPQHELQQHRPIYHALGSAAAQGGAPTVNSHQTLSNSKSAPTLNSPPGANRRVLPSLQPRSGAAAAAGANGSKWGNVRHKINRGPTASPSGAAPGAIASLARPSNGSGMSYSASLSALRGMPSAAAPSNSTVGLARAYGSNALVQSGLFHIVMAAKKVRTAGGGTRTVHVASGPGVAAGTVSGPTATIQSGKGGPPASLGHFALQGTSAPLSSVSPLQSKVTSTSGTRTPSRYSPNRVAARGLHSPSPSLEVQGSSAEASEHSMSSISGPGVGVGAGSNGSPSPALGAAASWAVNVHSPSPVQARRAVVPKAANNKRASDSFGAAIAAGE